jgi:hypothetical protein
VATQIVAKKKPRGRPLSPDARMRRARNRRTRERDRRTRERSREAIRARGDASRRARALAEAITIPAPATLRQVGGLFVGSTDGYLRLSVALRDSKHMPKKGKNNHKKRLRRNRLQKCTIASCLFKSYFELC